LPGTYQAENAGCLFLAVALLWIIENHRILRKDWIARRQPC
jgi:hypothetical protein